MTQATTNSPARKRFALLKEKKRRENHPFNQFVPYNTAQEHFSKNPAYIRLLFGGNRSGKSHCAAYDAVRTLSGKHPHRKNYKNPRVWCLSSEYRTLSEGLWFHIKRLLPDWWIEKRSANIPGWDIPHHIRIKPEYGGGRIDFISAQGGEEARRKVQAAQVDGIYIDEEIDGIMFHEIEMRLLDTGGFIVVSATLVRSEDWLLELEQEAENQSGEVSLFRLNTEDNPYLTKHAVKRITAKLSPEEYEVRIQGRSRQTQGLVFKEPIQEVSPFTVPKGWYITCALDPGYRVFAVLWSAVNPEAKEEYLFHEQYHFESTLDSVMSAIFAQEKITPSTTRLIDPSAFRHTESGGPGVGVLIQRDYNYSLSPAQNDVASGIEVTRSILNRKKLKLFSSLANFKREKNKYRIKPPSTHRHHDIGADRPLKRDDHLMDCWRYIQMHLAEYDPEFDSARPDSPEFQDIGIKYGTTLADRLERDRKRLVAMAGHNAKSREYAMHF